MEDLCAPQKASEKSFEEIKILLLEHFKLKYNVKQGESEPVSNFFFVRLKHLSSTYEFGTFVKRELRDKFACGLNDEKIEERLLSEDMSFEVVYKMAHAMELATANVAHIKNKDREDLHKMGTAK